MTAAKERRFFDALRDVFIGVPVEGESGYINLMRIKARYFQRVLEPHLQRAASDEMRALRQSGATDTEVEKVREEIFDKLYTFFRRYFTESGSLGFFFTPYHQSIYERVYTDDRDVMLFWKTSRLYYVKTDRLFRSMEVSIDRFRFFFDVSGLEHKKANEKRELVYTFRERRDDGTLVFSVSYSERGTQTKIDDIRRAVRDALGLKKYIDAIPSEEILERAFRIFERQSQVDYFICKDARSFLREQFDLWLWQYLLGRPGEEPQTEWTEARLRHLQALKRLAYLAIDLVAAFEDELVRIWNKPKFVLRSGYVITLDRVYDRDPQLVDRLVAHPGWAEQVREWRDLGIVGEGFSAGALWEHTLEGRRLHLRYRYLPVDTRYFKDLELAILALFDPLDDALDGWLIHSENYQALKTLLPKFRERVKCIYIDPPYNSESTEIDYLNRYKHSSWMSLMENRISVAKDFLSQTGIICVAIDDNEFIRLIHILSAYFPEDVGTIVVRSNPAGRSTAKGLSLKHEYALFYAKDPLALVGRLPRIGVQITRYREQDERGPFEWVNFRKHGGLREESPRMYYPVYINPNERTWRLPDMEWSDSDGIWIVNEEPSEGEIVIWPIDERGQARRWKWAPERLLQQSNDVKIDLDRNGQPAIYIKSRMPEGVTPSTWWEKPEYSATDYGARDLKDLFGRHGVFTYPKAVGLVEDCIRVCLGGNSHGIVLDFFAGSGTTAHAVINLNREDGGRRRYILVEMADYFYTVLLPRIKKVVFSDKWRDGKAQPEGRGISHFVKYYELEQYEDTLRRTRYLENDLFTPPPTEDPCQYLFLRDPKMLEALEVDLESGAVQLDLSRLYPEIDLAETLSNLLGKPIRRIYPDPNDPTRPGRVEFTDGTAEDLVHPDWRRIKPLIWW
jgi:adenine-specific DNA-methyltransferase